jgi:hypothetical protein
MEGRRLAIQDLLNADSTSDAVAENMQATSPASSRIPPLPPSPHNLVDIRPQLLRLATFMNGTTSFHAPPPVQRGLDSALQYLESLPGPEIQATLPRNPATDPSPPLKRSTNVAINRITTLEILYEYPVGHVLEYPETSSTGSIDHLFCMDPDEWEDPTLNIAYSRGGGGQSLSRTSVKCLLLVDVEGNPVECSERHTACM